MPVHHWFRQARYLAVLFMIAAAIPVAVLSWMGLRLLQQDRDLEDQQIHQRLEDAADRVAAEIEANLTRMEASLPILASAPPSKLPAGAVFVVFRSSTIDAWPPGRLLYYSTPVLQDQFADNHFWPGEKLEFQEGAYEQAAAYFRRLSQSKDSGIQAGALVRLGRNLRRLGRHEEALSAYAQLETLGDVTVGGVPAGLLGSHAQCDLLAELGRRQELRRAAGDLCRDLQSGCWRLDRASYEFYCGEVSQWLNGSCQPGKNGITATLAAVVGSLWQEWQRGLRNEATGRRTIWLNDMSLLVIFQSSSNRLLALVAAPLYIESEWQDVWKNPEVMLRLTDSNGRLVAGARMDTGAPRAVRAPADTRLPWTLYVASADPAADAAGLAGRRRLLMIGLAVMALALLTAGYLTGRAAARELAAARLQSNFVSAVSHEFRSPLTSMRHLTELLEDSKVVSPDRQRQYYGMLSGETKRLQRLVEGLLDFGRMEAGVMQYRPEKLDPGELVRQVVAEFLDESPQDGHHISFDTDSSAPFISVDSAALRSAVWNLLDNAAKYSPGDSAIEVSVAGESGRVAIRVRDYGAGIPVAEQKKIFERFFRGTSSESSRAKGTGIGLALVQHIVAAHNGEVRLESAPGRGSLFTILVPAAEDV
jgi:signal transduction histidine kinase